MTEDPLISGKGNSMDSYGMRGYSGQKLLHEIYQRKFILSKSAIFTMALGTYNTKKK